MQALKYCELHSELMIEYHFPTDSYLHVFDLTPWNTVMLEKLIATQLIKKLPALHGTHVFIFVF
jgi:hypothetical protein